MQLQRADSGIVVGLFAAPRGRWSMSSIRCCTAWVRPRYMEQPHFGLVGRNEIEVRTSVPLIAAWCLLLGYGYLQARRGVMSAEESGKPRAIALGIIVLSAAYLYVVATTIELGENYR